MTKELFPDGPAIEGPELINIFLSDPFPFLADCQKQYGDIFTLKLGTFGVDQYPANGRWVFLARPDYFKQVFQTPAERLQAGAANSIQFQQLVPAEGSVAIDGPQHITRRRILAKTLVGSRQLERLTERVYGISQQVIEQLPHNNTFSLAATLRDISNQVMQASLFGDDSKGVSASIHQHLCDFGKANIDHAGKRHIIEQCRTALANKVSHYQQCPVASDSQQPALFTTLLNPASQDAALSETQIHDELMTLLLGGADTTASMMTWTFAWLLSHPEIYQQLMAEVHTVLGDKAIDATTLEQLVYLDAVVKEVCRISPALFTTSTRLLLEPLQLDQQTIPAATIVANCAYLVHTNPALYPEPDQFKPERFLGVTPDPCQWLPFGGGIRRCIGMQFALHEIKTVVATLLQQLQLQAVKVSLLPQLQGSFFGPKGGLEVKLKNTAVVSV